LAKHLQGLGVVAPTGRPRWRTSPLRGILTNPTYPGRVYAGRWHNQVARTRHSATRPIGRSSATVVVPVPAAHRLVAGGERPGPSAVC
jgi:hypothetical protein